MGCEYAETLHCLYREILSELIDAVFVCLAHKYKVLAYAAAVSMAYTGIIVSRCSELHIIVMPCASFHSF